RQRAAAHGAAARHPVPARRRVRRPTRRAGGGGTGPQRTQFTDAIRGYLVGVLTRLQTGTHTDAAVVLALDVAQSIDDHAEATIMTRTQWIRSTRCSGGDCVEVAALPPTTAAPGCPDNAPHDGHVLVRDSKDPDGPRLRFTCDEWAA